MNYNTYKKPELIEMMETKDKEIKDFQNLKKELKLTQDELTHVRHTLEQKNYSLKKQVEELEKSKKTEIEILKTKFEGKPKEISDYYEKQLKRRTTELDELLNSHGAVLKSFQGLLDLAISNNTHLYTKITK